MATERRPARPATRVIAPASAPAKSPTSRVPSVPAQRPQTSRVPTAAPAKPATGRVPTQPQPQKRGTTRLGVAAVAARPARPAAAPKKNNTLVIGGVVGGVVLIAILAVVFMGGDDKKHAAAPAASKKEAPKKPGDYAQYERDGISKCDQGLKAIQDAYKVSDAAGLRRGISLIGEGNELINKAKDLGSPGIETNQYLNALNLARKKLMELK